MVVCKLSIQGGILMIHSFHFGRAFWLDGDNELCSAPWRKDGTVENLNWDYVGEWNDLEGVDMFKLLNIHRELILDNNINMVEAGTNVSAMLDASNIDDTPIKLSAEEVTRVQVTLGIKGCIL